MVLGAQIHSKWMDSGVDQMCFDEFLMLRCQCFINPENSPLSKNKLQELYAVCLSFVDLVQHPNSPLWASVPHLAIGYWIFSKTYPRQFGLAASI